MSSPAATLHDFCSKLIYNAVNPLLPYSAHLNLHHEVGVIGQGVLMHTSLTIGTAEGGQAKGMRDEVLK